MTQRATAICCFPVLLGTLLCLSGCRTSRIEPSERTAWGPVPLLTVPRTTTPPVIDGVLSGDEWKGAATIPALSPPWQAKESQLATLPTTIRVLWDEGYLYVGFECVDSDVYCSSERKHDDLLYKEDVCEVFIDGVGDGRQFVEVQVNPDGVNLDLMYVFSAAPVYTPAMRLTQEFCETERWQFLEWEMQGLRTAGQRRLPTEAVSGWCVELAIPAAVIMKRTGRSLFAATQIRANFIRYDWPMAKASGERALLQMNWSPVLFGNPHNSAVRMGRLNLVESTQGVN